MEYLIGVDGGTQSTKVLIFDKTGRVVAQGIEPLKPLLLPKEGVAQHPGDDLWDTLVAACKKAMAEFPGKVSEIVGLGLCTIRCCRALLKSDLSLAQPVLSWMDLRLARPYEHDDPNVAYVTTTTGYIGAKLTGNKLDTCANLLGEWPIDYATWDWLEDKELFNRHKIPREMLFDLVKPGQPLGKVTKWAAEATSLPEGLPVVATASDKAVEALGCGPLGDGTALLSLGTYICSMVEGSDFRPDSAALFTNMASQPFRFLYESCGIRRGMSTVSWVREIMGRDADLKAQGMGLTTDNYLNRLAAEIPPGSDGLLTVPEWLAPPSALHKKGVMLGFTGRTTPVHMYRSVMEAIAMTMGGHLRAMVKELDVKLERVIVSGGGSNGDLFMGIIADVMGIPAVRTEINGAVGLGSAICAAVGSSVYDSFGQAMAAMVRAKDTFKPNTRNHAFYTELYEGVYSQITQYTDVILKKAYPFFTH
ncbi:MAG: sugar kinase [Deltaproteobacteria bacterium]|jgi:sugar (pentulose or hexulose) kinase|nr:sugar kinase [Deltaproteobacteria bacterium]